jgi:uncharacterized membrane protein YhaH (DUF805 family)
LNFTDAIKSVLSKYASTTGRARRSEYWYWTLATALLSILVCRIYFLLIITSLTLICPTICLTIRRLHDIGKSDWWVLLTFIPFANFILVVFALLDSQPGANEYGENPKGIE